MSNGKPLLIGTIHGWATKKYDAYMSLVGHLPCTMRVNLNDLRVDFTPSQFRFVRGYGCNSLYRDSFFVTTIKKDLLTYLGHGKCK